MRYTVSGYGTLTSWEDHATSSPCGNASSAQKGWQKSVTRGARKENTSKKKINRDERSCYKTTSSHGQK